MKIQLNESEFTQYINNIINEEMINEGVKEQVVRSLVKYFTDNGILGGLSKIAATGGGLILLKNIIEAIDFSKDPNTGYNKIGGTPHEEIMNSVNDVKRSGQRDTIDFLSNRKEIINSKPKVNGLMLPNDD